MNYSSILNCRLCKSQYIYDILTFGFSPLANSYVLNQFDKENQYPLTVAKCSDCGHVQLVETVEPSILFSNYAYSSSDSPSLIKHFNEFANTVKTKLDIKQDNKIFEIGSNDGILLKEFLQLGFKNIYGIEPATNIAEKSMNISATIINDFFNLTTARDIKLKHGTMDLICANNVFAHVAEIDSMVQGINELLSQNGVFIFENAYLLDTIKGLYFDQIYHEHLQYYGIKPLVKYLNSFNLEIFHIQKIDTQGGSFRIFTKRKSNTVYPIEYSVQKFLDDEQDYKLYDNQTYIDFQNKINYLSVQMRDLINNLISHKKTICCYGCPAKFALFSKVFNLNNQNIQFVVDDSPLKQNKFSPGSRIPIVNNQYFKSHPTDYCIVSAWNMADSIICNNKDYSGKFIVPMPTIKII